MVYRLGKVLYAIGNTPFILVMKYFVNFKVNEHTRLQHFRDMYFFHPLEPFLFGNFVNSYGNII